MDNLYIFDFEVFAHDWLVVFKHKVTGTKLRIWNDNDAVKAFMDNKPLLAGFNNKHYDQFILKAILCDFTPEEVKEVNDFIITEGHNGWEHPVLSQHKIYFDQYDLKDDCQAGLSLKAIEGHLGMNICESTVAFDIDRPLTPEERREVEFYCDHDVDATDDLDNLRQGYLQSKISVGAMVGIPPEKALYMTNAKLTAEFLGAEMKEHEDEREYKYPENLNREYVPQEVFDFFNRLYDESIPDNEIFSSKLQFNIGNCPVVVGFGGVHAAIPNYIFKEGVVDDENTP